MKYAEFLEWLQTERNMNIRSARDVVSRIKRALIMLNADEINDKSIEKLCKLPAFLECSISVKSQIKRSIALYYEYIK